MLLGFLLRPFGKKDQEEKGRMIRLRGYKLYNSLDEMCSIEDVVNGEEAYVIGRAYDEDGECGKIIRTAIISDVYNKVIVTESGAVYILESMHSDYKDYLMVRTTNEVQE